MRWGERVRCAARRLGIGLAVLVVAAALPVLWIETRCVEKRTSATSTYQPILPARDRREEVNSYLTYPEWSIVHAYEDLAAVTRATSESDYDYFGAIGRYWSSLCSIYRLSSSRGTIAADYKVMLHVIGLSFAAEMGVKGLWEKTVGRIALFLRGPGRTPEDNFAADLAADYARFLQQAPWYDYPFGAKLWRFWADVPLMEGNIFRKVERRVALSLEWGAKAIYARAIAAGAGATMPIVARIRAVIAPPADNDATADPRIKVIETRPDGSTVIEVDRYRTHTEIMKGLAARGRAYSEIAGNRNILVTVVAPAGSTALPGGAKLLFEVPVAARPGWRRLALDVGVSELMALIRNLPASGMVLEHVYDY
jgi:hypothetical protein